MRKLLAALGMMVGVAVAAPASADVITAGISDGGNCIPYMCNLMQQIPSNTDYQQVYSASLFSGPAHIDTMTFTANPNLFPLSTLATSGEYALSWGYAAHGSVNNLSTDLLSNYISTPTLLPTYIIPYQSVDASLGFTLPLNFDYDPTIGDLLIEVYATYAGIDPFGSMYADDTGAVTSRAYVQYGSFQQSRADSIGLVTQFHTSAFTGNVPEPASIALLSGGLLMMRRRKKTAH